MRITHRAVATTSLVGLNKNLDAIATIQQQLTSGRTITKPSDSPTGTNRSMLTRSDAAANEQYARNISDGAAWLDTTDSVLTEMGNLGRKVRDLAVQGNNAGALSADGRTAVALQIAQLKEALVGLANTRVQGRPVFGGTTGGDVAYAADGTFVGRANTAAEPDGMTRRINDVEVVRVDVTGPEAFGITGTTKDLFSVVTALAADVATGADLAGHLTDLDAALSAMSNAHSTVGATQVRVDTAKDLVSARTLTLKSQLADIENVDLAKTIMELQMQQVGYQTALSATAKAIQPTLLDYLR